MVSGRCYVLPVGGKAMVGDRHGNGLMRARRGRASWLRAFSPASLSGVTLWGFCIFSALATGIGFADLRAANTGVEGLAWGELLASGGLTIFVVSAMVVALHNLVDARQPIWVKPIALVFYLLFAVWSVGFGFGFFWKELAGREFTRDQLDVAVAEMSDAVSVTSGALAVVETSVLEVAALATSRAELEARSGGTCANKPYSRAGDGPLVRGRMRFAERGTRLAGDVRRDWLAPLEAQRAVMVRRVDVLRGGNVEADGVAAIAQNEAAFLKLLGAVEYLSVDERRAVFARLHRDADAFSVEVNRLRGLHAEAFAGRLEGLAREVGAGENQPGVPDAARVGDAGYCWDVVLEDQLMQVAERLRGLEPVVRPEFAFLEGPEATRAAFFALVGWMRAWLPFGGGDSMGETQADEQSDRNQIPFGEKALLALFSSIVVDLGIFFLTVLRATRMAERGVAVARGQGVDPVAPDLDWVERAGGSREKLR